KVISNFLPKRLRNR
ncbi:hypothetical protein D029_0049B, partial [Vibrio parahaemolyticus 970107]